MVHQGKISIPKRLKSVINNKDYITESLVISEDNKLIGLIYPDFEMMKRDNISEEQLLKILDETRKEVNEQVT